MNWEKLTAREFEQGVKDCEGVCLLPIGVLERHGDHLPLGQDVITIHEQCIRAAELEPAMVFAFYFLGKIAEGRHLPGTIALKCELLIPVLENICDEISRNGLKKIIICNGHGGNGAFLAFFLDMMLEKSKDYMIYNTFPYAPAVEARAELIRAKVDGHGGEVETSMTMDIAPELVKEPRPADFGLPLGRLAAFQKLRIRTTVDWYADHPWHLAADQTPGSAEKGRQINRALAEYLADVIRLVKRDDTPIELYRKCLAQQQAPRCDFPA